MAKSHNKKRNIGIIYELLLRHISNCLINEDNVRANEALKIIEKRFDKSTEVYKEFRLFNALVRSTASSTSVVAAILSEAKSAARRCNNKNLNNEKSRLIKDINYNLQDESFYYRRIPEYTIYATIQTLLNDWRAGDRANLNRIIEYEGKVAEWLLSEKSSVSQPEIDEDVDALVVKIMTEKLNKKYSNQLNNEQRSLMKMYAIRADDENDDKIKDYLSILKEKTLISLQDFKLKCDNKILSEKFSVVSNKLDNINLDEAVTDSTISRFLTICDLKDQLSEALNE
jgi:hypothetical protein|tara:strand:+ start:1023 stop:1877 length:855 start_codon:yes stop_codon:yes gene_type:complete